MIKKFTEISKSELEQLMMIWLESNKEAHPFIQESYWLNHVEMVKELLPQSDVFIFQEAGVIVGFMGVMDGYIAGIFVQESARKKGIGSRLLKSAKTLYSVLSLDVYQKNQLAYHFYLKQGFQVISEGLDEENNEVEYHMVW